MTRAYVADRPDLNRVALIRDLTDELRQLPILRNVGLAARREIAVRTVDGALKQTEGTR